MKVALLIGMLIFNYPLYLKSQILENAISIYYTPKILLIKCPITIENIKYRANENTEIIKKKLIQDKVFADSLFFFITKWNLDTFNILSKERQAYVLIDVDTNKAITINSNLQISYNNSRLFTDYEFLNYINNKIPELHLMHEYPRMSEKELEAFNSIDLIFKSDDLGILPSKYIEYKEEIEKLYNYLSFKILNPNLTSTDYNKDIILIGDWILSHRELIDKEDISLKNVHLYNHPFYELLKNE